jgi:CBS domain-containing protein
VQAGDAMTTDLVTVCHDTPVLEAARAMVEAGVRHLPVLDGERAVGIVSIRDVLAVLVSAVEP